jgi:putative addiction module component (TIGR02574 family)
MSISSDELRELSVAERLELIETIWDSIIDEPDSLPLTDAQRQELDRRLDSYARQRPRLSTWDEVRARLERDE